MTGKQIIEEALQKALAGRWQDAPFGTDKEEAKLWHEAQVSAYLHALEMWDNPTNPVEYITEKLSQASWDEFDD